MTWANGCRQPYKIIISGLKNSYNFPKFMEQLLLHSQKWMCLEQVEVSLSSFSLSAFKKKKWNSCWNCEVLKKLFLLQKQVCKLLEKGMQQILSRSC
jgi:hypothetical protein